jgi:hypothetical protein
VKRGKGDEGGKRAGDEGEEKEMDREVSELRDQVVRLKWLLKERARGGMDKK